MFGTLAGLTDLAGAAFLDLYAGTGAVGLEALSRGAARVVLVESDPAAAQVISGNIKAVDAAGAHLVRSRVEHFLRGRPEDFDVIFADPPYDGTDADLHAAIEAVVPTWTAPAAVIVVERPTRGGEWVWPAGVQPVKARRYGDSTLWYGRRS